MSLARRTFPAAVFILVLGSAPAVAQQDSTRSAPPDSARRDTIMLAPVVVKAARPSTLLAHRTVSATKTDRMLRDVPQSVTVLTSSLLRDQSVQSMADAIRFLPGVSSGLGEGHRDAPTIRGNSSTADFFVDGVRDDAQYLRDVYNVERIEALKGPNAMVFGRGGGGGVINRVSKSPQWSPTRSLTLGGGSYEHKRTTADLGGAVTPALAARLNALFENSDQFRDSTTVERLGVHPVVALRTGPEDNTMVTLGYERFADRRTVNRGIPSFAGRPSDAPIATFFGDPSVSHSRTVVDAATATLERRSARGVTVRNRARFAGYDKYYQNVYPGGAVTVDSTGTTVSLAAYNSTIYRRNLFNQTDLTYSAGRIGGLRQTFLLGAEIGHQYTENYRNTGYFNDSLALRVPFASPTVLAPVTFRQSATDADNEVVARTQSLYAQDEITLGRRWQAVLGLRYDRFVLEFHNNRTTTPDLWRVDRKISPRAGVVFKPAEPVSIYTSYSVSFLPGSGDQFGSLTATTSTLKPERFENTELGVKWDVRPGLTVTGAAFHLDRTNTTAVDPNNTARLVQTGSQRSTGFELSAIGSITPRWEIAAAFASQDARIVSRTQAAASGKIVPLVPSVNLSLWNRYDVTPWLGAGLGVIHQDDSFAAIDNAVTLPGFTRVDLAAFVTINQLVRAQVNVENLFNTRYYATSHGNNNIMPGAPRSVRVTMTATP